MPAGLEPLEAAVLAMLLTGDHPVLEALRNQLASATIARRELTGVGFFLDFAVAASAVPASVKQLRFGDVEATLAGLEHGAGFVLFVDDGELAMLEGFSYGEPWPSPVTRFALRYHDPARSDLPAQLSELASPPDPDR
jgi:hypothetical protein